MVFRIIYTTLLIGMLWGIESCYVFRKPGDDTKIMCSRRIENQLGQDITLKVFSTYDIRTQYIESNSDWLMEKLSIADEIEPFESLNSMIDSVVVFSKENTILKIWRKSEQWENGLQFFDESSWKKREWEEGDYINYEWIFKIAEK